MGIRFHRSGFSWRIRKRGRKEAGSSFSFERKKCEKENIHIHFLNSFLQDLPKTGFDFLDNW